MKVKLIIACAVLLAMLLLAATVYILTRPSPPPIAVRHVQSARSGNVITMTFGITNYSSSTYIFLPSEVQIRNGTGWSKFQGFNVGTIHPIPTVNPMSLASYTLNVTNLPVGSLVRFSIRAQETLMGVPGFVRRAELNLPKGNRISLNPADRNSKVFGLPREVISDEFVEP